MSASLRRCRLAGLGRVFALVLALTLGAGSARAQKLVSPVHGYLSVEPYEIRLEYVVEYAEAARWLGLPEPAGNLHLDPTRRGEIERRVAEWLAGKGAVRVSGGEDGTAEEWLTFVFQRSHFVRPDAEKGLVVEDREPLPLTEARLGVVFSTPRERPPGRVRVDWGVFPATGAPAIVEIGSEDERITREATPQAPRVEWTPTKPMAEPALLVLPAVRRVGSLRLPWLALLLGLGAGLAGIFSWRRRRAGRASRSAEGVVFLFLGAALVAYGLGWGVRPWVPPWARAAPPTAAEADEITFGLLRNIYHAFDYRSEERIYDTLRASASEALVGRVFLEVTRSLQVEGQGGARVRVLNLDLRKCEMARFQGRPTAEFDAECEWIAIGNVTHWGHTHKRLNRYRALLTISAAEGQWRLAGIELRDETRL